MKRPASHARRIMVVKPNYLRRHGTARRMSAAGLPRWQIAHVLRMRPARLDDVLRGSALWSGSVLDQIKRELAA